MYFCVSTYGLRFQAFIEYEPAGINTEQLWWHSWFSLWLGLTHIFNKPEILGSQSLNKADYLAKSGESDVQGSNWSFGFTCKFSNN